MDQLYDITYLVIWIHMNRFEEAIPWQIAEMLKIDVVEAWGKKFSFGLNAPEYWISNSLLHPKLRAKLWPAVQPPWSCLSYFRFERSVGMQWDGFWHVLVFFVPVFAGLLGKDLLQTVLATDLSRTWYPCKELRWSHPCLQLSGKLDLYSKITYAWNYLWSIYSGSYVVVICVFFHLLIDQVACFVCSFIYWFIYLFSYSFIYLMQ